MKLRYGIGFLAGIAALTACGQNSSTSSAYIDITDMEGRTHTVKKGEQRVLCIGAGALRLYSYVGEASWLCGVEDIDNIDASGRPTMFDGVARPYFIANKDVYKTLPSCGVGGPQNQKAEAEKILLCRPDIVITEYAADVASALEETIGVPVVRVRLGAEGVFSSQFANSISLLGKIFDKENRAKELNDYVASEAKKIEDATKNIPEEEKAHAFICGLGNWGTTNQYVTSASYYPFQLSNVDNVAKGISSTGVQVTITEEEFVALGSKMDKMFFDAAAVKNIRGKGYDFSSCKAFGTGEVYLEMAYNAYYTNTEIALINTWFIAASCYPTRFADFDITAKANEVTTKFNGKALYEDIKGYTHSFGGYQKIASPTEFFA